MTTATAGISGFAIYLPPLRVQLADWCEWTGNDYRKVGAIVGHSFRLPSPRENVYTMAANAVLTLIERYEVNPRDVGMLVLGTESSTDNSAGAVILRAMLDRALIAKGLPALAEDCEVPEVKHACLGGIYGLKGACRYVSTDGAGRTAIVVAADIAEYERGSSGEQTQGAGAVAMLVDSPARLLALDLAHSGSASGYRGPDFRKPVRRYFLQENGLSTPHDFPVFNGRYSTYCYLDQTTRAFRACVRRLGTTPGQLLNDVDALFFHRPYHWMPVQTAARLQLLATVADPSTNGALSTLCREAGVTEEAVRSELEAPSSPFRRLDEHGISTDPTPALSRAAKLLRASPDFKALVERRMTLGAERMKQCGNMYTAALPAWLAAGLVDAREQGRDLAGRRWLALGYGSGDAAEAIPLTVVPGWEAQAERIGFDVALDEGHDLDRERYEALHDRRPEPSLERWPKRGFVIEAVGEADAESFQDIGLEYYASRG